MCSRPGSAAAEVEKGERVHFSLLSVDCSAARLLCTDAVLKNEQCRIGNLNLTKFQPITLSPFYVDGQTLAWRKSFVIILFPNLEGDKVIR